ncbi:DUF4178 domain-containing protein [Marinobacter sp. R17]|uniref:DUF4178 domain-containing protein n=1 Tax=Marinobacter sp. R17 TaxID=2484250 RepID=UPI000F4C5D4A|nr:DUF4178 domain-containing protein [Marinobacter sp. R17]ROU02149.1 DUF4178 domain-containing protein [Marinobacter sp. R17]
MVNLLLVIGFIALGVIGYRTWQADRTPRTGPEAPVSPGSGTIEQAGPGGVLQLPPHGPNREEQDVRVRARHTYRQDDYAWFELECEAGHGTVWVDVERDDELEASVTLKRLSLEELGLTPSSLSGHQAPAKTLVVDGITFRFSEQGRARFLRESDPDQAEDVTFWDYEGDDDRHDLGIERWGDDCRAYLTERINPERIRIYSLGGTT